MDESLGFLHDAEQPFCDSVLMENFAYDTNAKRWEEIDWCGDRYRVPVKDLQDNPLFQQDAVELIEREGLVMHGGLEFGRTTVERIADDASIVPHPLKKALQ